MRAAAGAMVVPLAAALSTTAPAGSSVKPSAAFSAFSWHQQWYPIAFSRVTGATSQSPTLTWSRASRLAAQLFGGPVPAIDGVAFVLVAACGLVCNALILFLFQDVSHTSHAGHDHGHSHDPDHDHHHAPHPHADHPHGPAMRNPEAAE